MCCFNERAWIVTWGGSGVLHALSLLVFCMHSTPQFLWVEQEWEITRSLRTFLLFLFMHKLKQDASSSLYLPGGDAARDLMCLLQSCWLYCRLSRTVLSQVKDFNLLTAWRKKMSQTLRVSRIFTTFNSTYRIPEVDADLSSQQKLFL